MQQMPVKTLPTLPPLNNPLKMMSFFNRFNQDPLGFLDGIFAEHGNLWSVEIGGTRVCFTNHPEVIRDVMVTHAKHFIKDADYTDTRKGLARFLGQGLLTSNGDFWRKQRKLVAPAFHTQRISEYAEAMTHFAAVQMSRWQDGAVLDIAPEMMETTLMIVARTLFSSNVRSEAEHIAHSMEVINQTVGKRSFLPTWLPTPAELSMRRAAKQLDEVVYGIIAQRRKGETDNGDLLSMLMLSEDEDGGRMSDKQVRDEAVTLMMAGHETTANTLNWTWLLLAQNPDKAALLREELDRVLGGRIPTLADLRNLPYTEQVIKESMRLYPPAWGIGRQADTDVQVMGYDIPAGTVVSISFYHLHRDAQWWDDANQFKPERFAAGQEHDKYTYMPFGGGARVCIGNSFAMMEAQLLLATFAQAWELELAPDFQVIPEPRITLYPRTGLKMRLKRRS